MDRYAIPMHLDDPAMIGLWTIDEAIAMCGPFLWGVMSQHIVLGVALAGLAWWVLRKVKAGRATAWFRHAAYWHLPAEFMRLKAFPPSHLRLMVG